MKEVERGTSENDQGGREGGRESDLGNGLWFH